MRGELEAEQNCNILTPTLMAITVYLSCSPGLLNRGPGDMFLIPASSLQLVWTSCAPSYIIIWHSLFFLRVSQFRTQFNPSTVKVISWYSSTGCTCYLHRYISCFDSLAGVSMLQLYSDWVISNVDFPFSSVENWKNDFLQNSVNNLACISSSFSQKTIFLKFSFSSK